MKDFQLTTRGFKGRNFQLLSPANARIISNESNSTAVYLYCLMVLCICTKEWKLTNKKKRSFSLRFCYSPLFPFFIHSWFNVADCWLVKKHKTFTHTQKTNETQRLFISIFQPCVGQFLWLIHTGNAVILPKCTCMDEINDVPQSHRQQTLLLEVTVNLRITSSQ